MKVSRKQMKNITGKKYLFRAEHVRMSTG